MAISKSGRLKDFKQGKITAEELVDGLSKGELEDLDKLLSQYTWLPTKGVQKSAYESEADIMLYGGAAGGGWVNLAPFKE